MLRKFFEEVLGFVKSFFEKEESILVLFALFAGGFFVFNFFSPDAVGYLKVLILSIGRFLILTWWLWFFLLFLPLVWSLWRYWRSGLFAASLKEAILEIKIPGQNLRTPMAMEQVFMALNTLKDSPFDMWERYFKGKFTRELSLEIMSFGGEVHFYMVVSPKEKEIIKAAFFSNYPDIEIEEVDEDYMERLPRDGLDMWRKKYQLWGSEFDLAKKGLYPIRTYPYFFEEIKEEKRVDPISSFLALASTMKDKEIFGAQIIISPAEKTWAKEFDEELKELRERKKEEKTGVEGDSSMAMFSIRSPGQTEVLKAVEANLAKPAFETVIRFLYVAPQEIFSDSAVYKGVKVAFDQYNTLDMNSFKYNFLTMTKTSFEFWPHFFPKMQTELRRQRLLYNFRNRNTPGGTFIGKWLTSRWFSPNNVSKSFFLNTESLATIFHIPTTGILTAPHLRRVESRKTGPPSGLPIFGEEEEISRFQ